MRALIYPFQVLAQTYLPLLPNAMDYLVLEDPPNPYIVGLHSGYTAELLAQVQAKEEVGGKNIGSAVEPPGGKLLCLCIRCAFTTILLERLWGS